MNHTDDLRSRSVVGLGCFGFGRIHGRKLDMLDIYLLGRHDGEESREVFRRSCRSYLCADEPRKACMYIYIYIALSIPAW